MSVSRTNLFLARIAWHFLLCEHWSFSKNHQPNICLNTNVDLLLKPNSKRFDTFWTWKRNRLFKKMKNANVCHLEVGVKRKLTRSESLLIVSCLFVRKHERQWNLDLTKCQATGEIGSLYRVFFFPYITLLLGWKISFVTPRTSL